MKVINIWGIPISIINYHEGVQKFCDFDQNSKLRFTATPNAEILLETKKNPELKSFLQKCDLNFADSVSVWWAIECINNNWTSYRSILELIFLPIRKKYWHTISSVISGADIFKDICLQASQKGQKIFLIGGKPNSAQKTVQILQQKIPNIIIDFYDDVVNSSTEKEICNKLNEFGAEIIFVALGCPKQELFLTKIIPKISSAKIGMGIGGTLDFFSGIVPRAPQFMRNMGLEWLFRLFYEPRRIIRIWRAVIIFPLRFLIKH